ncbi:MAG: hypothetical protein JWO30_104 [Fibrobacteres bacterium]|nr:hypothetical protein [Fibrobacterota bacterium]
MKFFLRCLSLTVVCLVPGCRLFGPESNPEPSSIYHFQGILGDLPFVETRSDTVACYQGATFHNNTVFCDAPGMPNQYPSAGPIVKTQIITTGYYLLEWKRPVTDETWILRLGPNKDYLTEVSGFQPTSVQMGREIRWKLSGTAPDYADFAEAKTEMDKETFFIELIRVGTLEK